jgi:hypothetical protein
VIRLAALLLVLFSACGDDGGLVDGAADAAAGDASLVVDSAPRDGDDGFPCGPSLRCEAGMSCCDSDPIFTCIELDQTCGGNTSDCDEPGDCVAPLVKCCDSGFGGQCLDDVTPCTGILLCSRHEECPKQVCCPQGFCGPGCD